MRKPLYLDVLQANEVALDQIALRVKTHANVTHSYPLRGIARIVVTGKVEWETQALLACLKYGIPVAFRQRDGQLLGHCLSDRSSQIHLESLLKTAADDDHGTMLYQQWRAHEENAWVKRMKKACGIPLYGTLAHSVMPTLQPVLQAQLPCRFEVFKAQIAVPIANHCCEILSLYGFSDNIHLPFSRQIHLSRDLESLILLEVWWWLMRNEVRLLEKGLRYSVIHFYESYQTHWEERARIALNRLWRLLKQVEVD